MMCDTEGDSGGDVSCNEAGVGAASVRAGRAQRASAAFSGTAGSGGVERVPPPVPPALPLPADPAAVVFPPPGWQALDLHPDAYDVQSYMGLGRLPGAGSRVRRIDIKSYPRDLRAFALLYFTGSDHHNRSMRNFANRVGWTLSDRGLSPAARLHVKGRASVKLWTGFSLRCDTEADVFAAMGAPFRAPERRNCEAATVPLAAATLHVVPAGGLRAAACSAGRG
jgi:hypothetical protein